MSPSDDERPELQAIREEAIGGAYTLVLEFDSPLIKFETWQEKREKIERFFGPGLRVEVTQGEDDYIEVALITSSENTEKA